MAYAGGCLPFNSRMHSALLPSVTGGKTQSAFAVRSSLPPIPNNTLSLVEFCAKSGFNDTVKEQLMKLKFEPGDNLAHVLKEDWLAVGFVQGSTTTTTGVGTTAIEVEDACDTGYDGDKGPIGGAIVEAGSPETADVGTSGRPGVDVEIDVAEIR
ncbi:hypothetical protein BT96DRAFT_1006852 [Gymnopus androsaceus JB14]|uniref:Uncharacterized protein n=1 Tax=Gymnopus androsaceus JB14 TaxID=1447944 RepID=A0A6A4GK20_9AGAR|nr:hypothetical protein BT96DRAFT_1006852 [Gymnopus androsaceus JB14]